MSPEQLARFMQLIHETVVLFRSMSDTIIDENPAWEELDDVLTDRERLIFDAFIAWSVSDTTPPQVPPKVGP